jgi:hypothetical protein
MKEERQKYERPEGVLSPLKAIRAKCLDCMCGSFKEVSICPIENCQLYAYRFGRRPKNGSTDIGDVQDEENNEIGSGLADEEEY